MTAFADEMRGSEGERCTVVDLRTGESHAGTVESWDDANGKAIVQCDNGLRLLVGYSFVMLEGEWDAADEERAKSLREASHRRGLTTVERAELASLRQREINESIRRRNHGRLR